MGQSVSVLQAMHAPSLLQTLPGCDAQSAFVAHWTQVECIVSQTGVLPEHPESEVHPRMQVKARGLQMGLASPQSALSRHATQRPVAAKQRGAPAGQSASAAQATHDWVVRSQILLLPVQSLASSHATHSPVGSHLGVARGHTVAALPEVQAG